MLREIVLQAMELNIQFQSEHISGVTNVTADLLSRLQTVAALKHSPELQDHPDRIPQEKDIWKSLSNLL